MIHDPIVCEICENAHMHALVCFFMTIVVTVIIGFGVYFMHKLSLCYEETMTTREPLERVNITVFKRILNDRDLFIAVLLCAASAFLIFRSICFPLMEHFYEVNEHYWMRGHMSMMTISIVSYASYITLYLTSRRKVKSVNVANSENKEEIDHIVTHMKLGWLILGSLMADISLIFLFWVTI